MRDIPILTFRANGSSTSKEIPWVIPFLEEARSIVEEDGSIMGELGAIRIAELIRGLSVSISIVADGIQLRLIRNGRRINLHTPNPYRNESRSRLEEEDFAQTCLSMIGMTLSALSADLIPEEERQAMDDERRRRFHAIAMAVTSANARPLDSICITPPGPVDDRLAVLATSGDMDARVPTTVEHLGWMPIRCVGLGISTTMSGASIEIRQHAGWMRIDTDQNPIAILRGMANAVELSPAPAPVIPDDEWDVIF